jgi:hypothetical protein
MAQDTQDARINQLLRKIIVKPFRIICVSEALFLSNKVWPNRDLAILRELGIGAIVNLTEDYAYVAPPGIACLASAFPDGGYAAPEQLREIYSFIKRHRGRGNVLVHCSAGVSRSAGIVAGQLMLDDPAITWDQAVDMLNARQSVWVSVETRDSVLTYLFGGRVEPARELHPDDAEVLRRVEYAVATALPEVRSISWNTRGYVTDGGRVAGIGLCGLDLAKLPAAVLSLHQLRELWLLDNRIEELPGEVGSLRELRTMNLSGNHLTALPASIGELSHLRELNVARNRLHAIPDTVGRLAELKRLYLHECAIEVLPQVLGGLCSLEELYVQNNRLRRIPDGIGDLSRLRRLALDCNELDTLPASIDRLSQLTALNVARNRLTALPDEWGGLASLDNFNISSNRLDNLPRGITALACLRRLNIALNPFIDLPGDVERWLGGLRHRGCFVIREGCENTMAKSAAG